MLLLWKEGTQQGRGTGWGCEMVAGRPSARVPSPSAALTCVWLERITCASAVTEIHEDKSHKSGFPRECSEERKVPSLDTAWGEGLA